MWTLLKKAEETVRQSDEDDICIFCYGESLKKIIILHVMPLSQTKKDEDEEIIITTRSQLLLEEFDSDGNYIGSDSDTEESEGEQD